MDGVGELESVGFTVWAFFSRQDHDEKRALKDVSVETTNRI